MAGKNVVNYKMFNKLSEKRVHHGKRDDYVYDSLYRLTEYRKDGDLNGNSPAKTIGYTLDGVGNRTQVTENGVPSAYTVNNLNQYTSVGGVLQTHDDNGNLTSDGTRTFSYDYANRLVRIVTATQTIDYKYDVFGRRIEKSVNGTGSRYYYEGDHVIEDRDGADAVSATYVFGNGIDEILTMDRGGQTYYYHTNAQGSITEITDSTGAIVERYEYDAYGAITIFTAPGVDGLWQTADDVVSATSAIGNRYTFTGREYESESGLYYYRARFYDPATGRFLQRDPIGEDVLDNLYTYVNNSPAVYVDPMGLYGILLDDDGSIKIVITSGDTLYGIVDDLKSLGAVGLSMQELVKANPNIPWRTTGAETVDFSYVKIDWKLNLPEQYRDPTEEKIEHMYTPRDLSSRQPTEARPNTQQQRQATPAATNRPYNTEADIRALAIILNSEIGTGNEREMLAIAWATYNRAVMQRTRTIANVTGVSRDQPNLGRRKESLLGIARSVLGGQGIDITRGSTDWYSPRSMPAEGEATGRYDVRGGLETVPGLTQRHYRPMWSLNYTYNPIDGVREGWLKFYSR